MAAPDHKDTTDLVGTWTFQGVPWVVRKVLRYASLSMEITQTTSLPETSEENVNEITNGNGESHDAKGPFATLHIKQTVHPGGFDSIGSYPVDGKPHDFSLPIFGDVSMQLRYVNADEVPDETLAQRLGEGSPSKTVIDEVAHNTSKGWQGRVMWGFEIVDGKRYFTRNVTTTKAGATVIARMVYDFQK
ncbi:hypothetical protein NUU61_009524 [Penicillium alfredii]|uniref:Lipocalin-like domain-containing protein n=1 Tax=Penicillium alfredii TaxID=1506179 RepID=A0A9W9JXC4_9EURO|nr:uncharacterized protein NUU61_009524 [Penicillium alfredii]KAJ5084945.1 hypothetical protein NUU61_009524 [Penicillium alfredii]